ncbi:MAG TPA: FAD-dependent oxidoreductase [Mycobacteriales bacterium]|nr:FAD-dependent oxidoreductase [Mycobacteriales bacterium]
MRACIVGGGLAGSVLAWRLSRSAGWEVALVAAGRGGDATAASGGAVRAYEEDPGQRRLAAASLAELLASPTLRDWSGYRETGSVCLRADRAGLADAVEDIEAVLPGSVDVATAEELARDGWAGLPAGAVGLRERRAGHLSPARLRDAVLADCRPRVSISDRRVSTVQPRPDGLVRCAGADYDVAVLATGPWTPAVLAAAGLPAGGYRTKAIQYAVHRAGGRPPPQFVDGLTGLFGRPTADGGLLLGLPTDRWDVDPDRPVADPALPPAAAALVRSRFPALRLGPGAPPVAASDCYAETAGLALRRVVDTHPVFTFTGGGGGSAKTVLAAGARAALELGRSPATGPPAGALPAGRTEGRR